MDQQVLSLVEDLTPRETDILELIAEGLSNPDIAQRLVLETATVKWYVRQLYGKLQITDDLPPRQRRRQMVEVARNLGLTSGDTAPTPPRHNLPAQTTPFIGRERELADLSQRISDPAVRLITVLAAGGMGKTRLALEAARRQLQSPVSPFANGIYFVPLQALSSPDHLVTAIGEHSGFQFMADEREPKQQLLDYLRHKQMLLVLDNFEHLLAGVDLISDILTAAPGVQVLVTSRERLNLRAETVFSISGLTVPEEELSADDAGDYEAISLFIQTARQVCPDFVSTDDNLPDITRICQLVAGMPLGIILAAAWVEVLSPAEIAAEIVRSIDILAAKMRDVPRRQWSIRAVFEPTWARLSTAEQAVFMKFAVFRGGCTRDAAQAVTGVSLPELQALVSKALLARTADDRYQMHELLRQYAEGKLDEAGEAESVRDTHAQYYARFMAERETDLKGWRQVEALQEIQMDFENVRVGWDWVVAQAQYPDIDHYLESLSRFFSSVSRISEAVATFRAAVNTLSDPTDDKQHAILGRVMREHGRFLSLSNRYQQAEDILHQSLDIARKLNITEDIANCLAPLPYVVYTLGRADEAQQLNTECLTRFQAIGDQNGIAGASYIAGFLAFLRGEPGLGERHTLESLTIWRQLDMKSGIAIALNNMAAAARHRGQWDQAEDHYRESIALHRELGNLHSLYEELGNLADVAWYRGQLEEAQHLVTESEALYQEVHGQKKPDFVFHANFANQCGAYEDACQLAQEALAQAKRVNRPDGDARALSILGWAMCGLGDYERAASHLRGALIQSSALHILFITADVLAGIALLKVGKGEWERALELLALFFHQPTTPPWYPEQHALFASCLTRLKTELPPNRYDAAWERGASLDLDSVIDDLLNRWDNATSD